MEDSKLSILRFVFGPRLAVLLLTKVELVEVPAGTVAATAGVPGHWRTYVLYGTVATTSPNRSYSEGGVVEHGPETALLALTRTQLLTVDAHEPALPTSVAWQSMASRQRVSPPQPQTTLLSAASTRRVRCVVLAEAGSADDLATWLNRDALLEAWPSLYLPRLVRRAWEDRHPELAARGAGPDVPAA